MRVTIFDDTNSNPVAGMNTAANKFNAWVQTRQVNVIGVRPVVQQEVYNADYGPMSTYYCMLVVEWAPYENQEA